MAVEFLEHNPKNVGSASWDRYEKYKKATTLAQVVPMGGKSADIQFDYTRGYLRVPGGGEYRSYRLLAHTEGRDSSASLRAQPPPLRAKGFVPRKPLGSQDADDKDAAAPSGAAAEPLSTPPPTASAWEITDDDKAGADRSEEEGDEEEEEEEEEDEESEEESRRFASALQLFDGGDLNGARALLAGAAKTARATRLQALISLKTTSSAQLRGILRRPTAGQVPAARRVSIVGELPTRFDHLEGEAPRRELAKETRGETRHVPRGVAALFELRLKDMLDDLTVTEGQPQTAAKGDVQEVTFTLKDEVFAFQLHKDSHLPNHAEAPLGTGARRKGAHTMGLVQLILSAAAGARPTGQASEGDLVSKLVNRYGKGGSSPLAVAAKSGMPLEEALRPLLLLGADPSKAMVYKILLSRHLSTYCALWLHNSRIRPPHPSSCFCPPNV